MALVEDRLDELRGSEDRSAKCGRQCGRQQLGMRARPGTDVFLHVDLGAGPALEADEVAEHAAHQVFAVDDDLLVEVLDPAWVRDKVCLGQPCLDLGDERVGNVWPRHRRRPPRVKRAGHEQKVRGPRQLRERGDEVGEARKVFCQRGAGGEVSSRRRRRGSIRPAAGLAHQYTWLGPPRRRRCTISAKSCRRRQRRAGGKSTRRRPRTCAADSAASSGGRATSPRR